jgi:hypothetical protein
MEAEIFNHQQEIQQPFYIFTYTFHKKYKKGKL